MSFFHQIAACFLLELNLCLGGLSINVWSGCSTCSRSMGVDEWFRTMDRDSDKCTVCYWMFCSGASLFLLSSSPLMSRLSPIKGDSESARKWCCTHKRQTRVQSSSSESSFCDHKIYDLSKCMWLYIIWPESNVSAFTVSDVRESNVHISTDSQSDSLKMERT